MSKPDLDGIIRSPSAETFLRMVTKGFYDSSYMGLWMYEVIGREWDEMRKWAEGLRNEINPQTCTWSIGIWEWVYGLVPDDSLSLAYRRRRILARIIGVKPINPESIRRGIQTLTGRKDIPVEVKDFTGPYQFSIIMRIPDGSPFTHKGIAAYVRGIKPSHLRLHLEYAVAGEIYTQEEICFISMGLHWKLLFWLCRTFDGTWSFDGGLRLDAERGYKAKAGLKLNFGAFANVGIFDGSWEFDGNLVFDAVRQGMLDIHCLELRTGAKLIEQFLSEECCAKFHYKASFWGNVFFDGSFRLDGDTDFGLGRDYTAKPGLKLGCGGFANASAFDGTWLFDGNKGLDAERSSSIEIPELKLRSEMELPEKFQSFIQAKAVYAIDFWQQMYLDGIGNFDGSWIFKDQKRQECSHGTLAVSYMAAANHESIAGVSVEKSRNRWRFDGACMFRDAKLLNAFYEKEEM